MKVSLILSMICAGFPLLLNATDCNDLEEVPDFISTYVNVTHQHSLSEDSGEEEIDKESLVLSARSVISQSEVEEYVEYLRESSAQELLDSSKDVVRILPLYRCSYIEDGEVSSFVLVYKKTYSPASNLIEHEDFIDRFSVVNKSQEDIDRTIEDSEYIELLEFDLLVYEKFRVFHRQESNEDGGRSSKVYDVEKTILESYLDIRGPK